MGKTRDLFKKIRDTKGIFYAKMGTIKDRNGMDLTEAEDMKKRWPKYYSFSFSIIPSKEHPGLISFRMDWLDLFAVQGTLKSLLLCCWKRVFAMTSAFSWQKAKEKRKDISI